MKTESVRQRQISELIKRNFSLLLQQEGRYIYGTSALVTVTNVRMSPDLALASIYVSIFNIENKQAVILEMEHSLSQLRQGLASRIKKQVRIIPDLQFFIDDTIDEMYRVDALFNKLQQDDEHKNSNKEPID